MENNDSETMQKDFLKDQFFLASWAAAVRHNRTWTEITEQEERLKFRGNVKKFLEEILLSYTEKVGSDTHAANIKKLQDATEEFGERCKIGTCQKLMNLLCKYYWCAGWIAEPPHCPLDRKILRAVGINRNWTEIDDLEEYKTIIKTIEEKARQNSTTVAAWELCEWQED